jgi:hypothetical protein
MMKSMHKRTPLICGCIARSIVADSTAVAANDGERVVNIRLKAVHSGDVGTEVTSFWRKNLVIMDIALKYETKPTLLHFNCIALLFLAVTIHFTVHLIIDICEAVCE